MVNNRLDLVLHFDFSFVVLVDGRTTFELIVYFSYLLDPWASRLTIPLVTSINYILLCFVIYLCQILFLRIGK